MSRKIINLADERQRRSTDEDVEACADFAAEAAVEANMDRSRFVRLCALLYDKFKRKLGK